RCADRGLGPDDVARESSRACFRIESTQRGLPKMIEHWRRLVDARDLLYTWTIRELKVRYAGSLLGLAWALLYPLALLLVSMVMFAWFLRVPTAGVPAALFLYCGLVPWLFSSGTIQNSAFALFANLQ